jgi:ParB-like chromosome segregation protein Spo0J
MTGEPYQVMPPLSVPEYDALKASIAAGYDPARPIVVDENGAVLDGHHRQQVCAELGITPPAVTLPGLTEDQKHDYAMRANLAQRHLSQLQKRELIRAELERDAIRSDREIGRLCGADHKTVAAVRRDGEFPQTGRWQRSDRRSAEERLAGLAAGLIDQDDEIEAAHAAAEACAAHWREAWARIVDALQHCAEVWTPTIVEHTGYADCLEWLQNGPPADSWKWVTENVSALQSLEPWQARWFGTEDAPIAPLIADVESQLRAAA